MALFLRQHEDRSKLQSKVAADLEERLKSREQIKVEKPDSAILEDQHTTRGLGVTVAVIVILTIGVIFWLVSSGSG